MEFSRQEYWSGLAFPSPGHLPGLGIELWSPALQADSLPPEPPKYPNLDNVLHVLLTTYVLYFYKVQTKAQTS